MGSAAASFHNLKFNGETFVIWLINLSKKLLCRLLLVIREKEWTNFKKYHLHTLSN